MQFNEALDTAARKLRARSQEVAVVAVDGHSAAGKSTFADALARRIGAAIITGDDFYSVMQEDRRARLSPREGIDAYYDWQRIRDEALFPLRAGSTASYRPYDWNTGQLALNPRTIAPAPAVVLEGLFVSREELQPFLDLSILIVAPASDRWQRQMARGDAEEWLRRWEAAERLFFEQIRTPQTFDIVVNAPPAGAG